MELFRATVYRQTMFSEFERKIYDRVLKDEALTADILSDIYYDLNKDYFGENVYIDDEIRYEWERIPHFYYNFAKGRLNYCLSISDYTYFIEDYRQEGRSVFLQQLNLSKEERDTLFKKLIINPVIKIRQFRRIIKSAIFKYRILFSQFLKICQLFVSPFRSLPHQASYCRFFPYCIFPLTSSERAITASIS